MNQDLKIGNGLIAVLLLTILLCSCSKHNKSVSGQEATLQDLNRALVTWGMMQLGPAPTKVSDLTNSPVLQGKHLPTPPPGKKFVIDYNQQKVVVVDQ